MDMGKIVGWPRMWRFKIGLKQRWRTNGRSITSVSNDNRVEMGDAPTLLMVNAVRDETEF